jgi:hypothetical protein
LDYWRRKAGADALPDPRTIDPLEFKFILGYVTLVDVETGPKRYWFRLDGSILVSLSGTDYTGKYLDQLDTPEYCAFIEATYDRVVDNAAPYAYRKQGAFDKVGFSEETLILPWGEHRIVQRLMVAVIPGDTPGSQDKILI